MFRFVVPVTDLWQLDHLMSDSTIALQSMKPMVWRYDNNSLEKMYGVGLSEGGQVYVKLRAANANARFAQKTDKISKRT